MNNAVRQISRSTGWALLVSILLNLFLVGILVGVVPHAPHGSGRHKSFGPMALAAPHGDYLVGWIVRYLDPPDAEIFRAAFAAKATELKQAHEHMRDATAAISAAFRRDPADPAGLQKALDRLHQAKTELDGAVGAILQSADAKLSPEGRKRLADLTQDPM